MNDLTGKKVLITSGGTLEKWDQVRGHTNLAKGIIGSLIAEKALAHGADVIYLHGYFARLPEHHEQMRCYPFEGIEDLGDQIQSLLVREKIDAVIMSAAASDWVIDQIMDQEGNIIEQQGKMSSDNPPVIRFKKAPKVIREIKKWQPGTMLIAFKLEDYTDPQTLINRALQRMETNFAEFTVANGSNALYGNSSAHFIVSRSGDVVEWQGKEETARAVVDLLVQQLQP